jgi:17beta-estradiol 17-dehydrogenase / very-long-chain 3-oxoacyl-CoA reductase
MLAAWGIPINFKNVPEWANCTLATIGVLVALRFVLSVLGFVWLHFLRPSTNLSRYGAKKGGWAVVTGASEGIGRGFAEALAARGFNLVLVARNSAPLQALAQDLEAKRKIQTQIVVADCSDAGTAALDAIRNAVDGTDLAVLVNNVGVNTALPTALAETDDADVDRLVAVNVRFTTKLTKLLLPVLRRRKNALILNIGSTSGVTAAPLMPIYAASKAYGDVFARALRPELAVHGIEVVSVGAHFVVSLMSGFKKPSFFVPSAYRFACDALAKVGTQAEIWPYWPHDLLIRTIRCFPRDFISNRVYGMMKATRKRLIAKAKRDAEKGSSR